jgi:hypothetical protein
MALSNADRQRLWRQRRKEEKRGFDPATQAVYDRAEVEGMRERLQAALLKLERREQDVARLDARNAHLEGELKRLEQHHTLALKEIVTLKRGR